MGQDAGVTFTLMDSSSAHTDPVTATIDVISRNTIIRVDVDDDAHTGGFIATVDCLGQTYSTLNPITSSNWKMISALSRNLNIEYRTDGSTAWYLAQPGIADDPVIIWNGVNSDNIRFEFDFANLDDLFTTASPTKPSHSPSEYPTPSPTLYPTTYNPSTSPTAHPSVQPIFSPSNAPTNAPTKENVAEIVEITQSPTVTALSPLIGASNGQQNHIKNNSMDDMMISVLMIAGLFGLLMCFCCCLCIVMCMRKREQDKSIYAINMTSSSKSYTNSQQAREGHDATTGNTISPGAAIPSSMINADKVDDFVVIDYDSDPDRVTQK